MRGGASLVVVLFALSQVAACKTKNTAEASAADPAAIKAQEDLLARRDKLLEKAAKLKSDKAQLEGTINVMEAQGSDTSAQKKQLADIDHQLDETSNAELGQVNTKLDEMKATGDRAAAVATREAEVASRERALADREARVAEREKELVQRDAELAQRWKDSCTVGPATTMVIQAPKAGNYTKRDVSDLIAHAKSVMARKGLLVADLPGPAQALEGDASKAINDGDMSRAYFAAAQLASTADSIQINRTFIQAKIARLQGQIKASKQDPATTQQLSSVLSDVIQKFGDGNFAGANQRLNQLAGMLR